MFNTKFLQAAFKYIPTAVQASANTKLERQSVLEHVLNKFQVHTSRIIFIPLALQVW